MFFYHFGANNFFFVLTGNSIEKGGKHKNFKVSSPESVPIYLKMVVISYCQQNDTRPVTSERI